MLILNILSIFPCYGMITDDFAETTLDKNLKIKLYKPKIYRDDFAENNKQIINKTVIFSPCKKQLFHIDSFSHKEQVSEKD